MWSRKRIDIGWSDLVFAFRNSFGRDDPHAAAQLAESAFGEGQGALACLSVRSGLDLLLAELALPPGSEILMSAVTIRDMARIVEEHGLAAVPVDLDPATMAVDPVALRRAVTPRTRAIIVAQLFGTIADLTELTSFCQQRDILVLEDCAQAFDGRRYTGHAQSDVVMFSFGPIKTATALAGGMFLVRDGALRDRLRTAQAAWPRQSQREFRRRVCTYAMLKLISGRIAFSLLVLFCRLLRKDYDRLLNGAVRNFPVDGFFASLRRQPCPALLRLLARRISSFDLQRQDRRSQLGRLLANAISEATVAVGTDPASTPCALPVVPSAGASRHTWWVFPLSVPDSAPVIHALRAAGFDATCGSQLQPVPEPSDRPETRPAQASEVVRQMMFLPLYPELSPAAVLRMGRVAGEVLSRSPVATPVSPAVATKPAVSAG
jgi:dTDP-4-amino-4,6-dideoxygalactose transaminase